MNIDKTTISNKFKEVFHTDVDEVYFSPGCINLIGNTPITMEVMSFHAPSV